MTSDAAVHPMYAVCREAYRILPLVESYQLMRKRVLSIQLEHFCTLFQAKRTDFEAWASTECRLTLTPTGSIWTPWASPDNLSIKTEDAVASNYLAAFLIHISLLQLEIMQQIHNHRVGHVKVVEDTKRKIRQCVETILFCTSTVLRMQGGLECVIFLMFLVDACWLGCESLDIATPAVVSWFKATGATMKARGFPPFRTPWL